MRIYHLNSVKSSCSEIYILTKLVFFCNKRIRTSVFLVFISEGDLTLQKIHMLIVTLDMHVA